MPTWRAYPQSAYRKGGVFNLRLNTPVAKATSRFRKRNSEPLTTPSAEGAFGGVPPRKAFLQKKVPAIRGQRGSFPPPRTVAAALSAAVTSTNQQETAPNFQAEPTPKNRPNPNASRSSGGSAREGLLSEKPPPSHTPFLLTSTRRGRRIRGSAARRRCGRRAGAAHPARGWSRGDRPDSRRFHRRHPLSGPSSHRSAD